MTETGRIPAPREAAGPHPLTSLLEAAPDALLVVAADGRILAANEQADQLFGHPVGGLLGGSVDDLVPAEHREGHQARRAGYGRAPHRRPMGAGLRLSAVRRDGTRFPAEISLGPLAGAQAGSVVVAVRDIGERLAAESARARLAALVASADLGIVALDPAGRITDWNDGATRLFGRSAAEMTGGTLCSLLPADAPDCDSHQLAVSVRTALSGRQVPGYDLRLRHRDGTDLDVSANASAIRGPGDVVEGVSVVLQDVRGRKDAERELQAFNYAVAHDLRAPLRGVDGFSQALLEDCAELLDDTGRGYLAEIRRSAAYMNTLIEGLLALARIGGRAPEPVACDLAALARSTVERLRAADPGREVEVVLPAEIPVVADPALLGVVVDNLLGNAWKFTRGRPAARIEVGTATAGGEQHHFVADDGVGFDMAYYDKLFAVFQRLHPVSAYEGTGIGLATTRRILARHGGRIWAEGRVGEGAVVRFTLGRTHTTD